MRTMLSAPTFAEGCTRAAASVGNAFLFAESFAQMGVSSVRLRLELRFDRSSPRVFTW